MDHPAQQDQRQGQADVQNRQDQQAGSRQGGASFEKEGKGQEDEGRNERGADHRPHVHDRHITPQRLVCAEDDVEKETQNREGDRINPGIIDGVQYGERCDPVARRQHVGADNGHDAYSGARAQLQNPQGQ
jgi:hypothetical protein